MTDYPTDAAASCLLDDYTTLRFRGPDAGKFLQGQLSNDLDRLQPAAIMRAGLHNPQGRTLALLWLAKSSEGDILALLPQELAGAVTTQLRRYLLRARLTITDESAQHQVCGHWQPGLVELPTGLVAAGRRARHLAAVPGHHRSAEPGDDARAVAGAGYRRRSAAGI